MKNNYESIDEVNFAAIKNKRSQEQNRSRLEQYIAFNDVYNIKSFKSIIEQVREDLENNRSGNSNNDREEDENQQFEKEISKRKKIDILKYYKDFVSHKRGRYDD